MNSVVRSVARRALHRREVRDRLQRRPAAAPAGNKNKQAAAAAAYSTAADRLAAYRYRTDGGYLLVPALVAVGAGTWLIAAAATRYLMTPPRQGKTTTTATPVEGRMAPEAAAASPSD